MMNEKQIQIYKDLMKLVSENEAFYFKDFYVDIYTYRIFNYRLSSYSDFLNPSALESRGIMFEVHDDVPLRLASRPMEKFFNYKENPFTENVDFTDTQQIMLKEDGSLISSYMHNDDELCLKSKGSINSVQAQESMAWLQQEENEALYRDIRDLTELGHTVNMEWTAPQNRIVIGYEKEQLVILNIRNNENGYYVDFQDLNHYPELLRHEVQDYLDYVSEYYDDMTEFVEQIKDEKKIEGYVIRTNTGQMVKVKTEWYLSLHRVKDSIDSPIRLFNAIITESIDDALAMFHDDIVLTTKINNMISEVEPKFNHMVDVVNEYHENNKQLTRKDYAVKAQTLKDGLLPLYMNLYIGRENDYKEFALKRPEMFIDE